MNRSIFAAILGMTLLLSSYPMLSETRGSVHGKVWDPTEAVIAGATVTVRNIVSGQTWMAQTGQDGEYEIDFVQTGHYALTAEAKGFQPAMQYAIIAAGQRVEVNFHLVLAVAATGEVSVADVPAALETRSTSVQNSFGITNITHLAGASESVVGLEAYTGSAWRSQEHLHIRGAHQVGYQVNGIAIQDLASFEPPTPFIDPRNLKFAEVTTGGLMRRNTAIARPPLLTPLPAPVLMKVNMAESKHLQEISAANRCLRISVIMSLISSPITYRLRLSPVGAAWIRRQIASRYRTFWIALKARFGTTSVERFRISAISSGARTAKIL
jgi:hypothetical protein